VVFAHARTQYTRANKRAREITHTQDDKRARWQTCKMANVQDGEHMRLFPN